MDKIRNHLIWIYPLLALVIYWPTRHAGFVHDFTGWFERYQKFDWSGIPHCFGYHRLQHVMHFFHFLIFKAFDTSAIPWYAIYAILFGLNAYLVYWLGSLLVQFVGSKDRWIPWLASLFFLIHPYQTTAVVWKVCFHYLLATFFVLLIIGLTIKWLKSPSKKKLALIFVLYLLSLFTQELTVAVPLISLILVLFSWANNSSNIKKSVLLIVIPQLLILPLYFKSAPLLLSNTGKDPLLAGLEINVEKQLAAVYRYGSKHSIFTRYWSHPAKEDWKLLWDNSAFLYSAVGLCLVLLVLFFIYYKKVSSKIKLCVAALLIFASAIGPFSSTYESYILLTTNDMYGFSASAFIILALVSLIRFLPRRFGNVLLILYGMLSFVFLGKTLYYWHENGHVTNSLLNDFRWHDEKSVFVLASPDNFMGSNMMKSHESSMIDDHLLVHHGVYPSCHIEDIIQFNMVSRTDGVSVLVHSQDSLSVKFNQWGTWHWRDGIGATSYENDKFRVTLAMPYYHLKRKNVDDDAIYIYQDGDKWYEVKEWNN